MHASEMITALQECIALNGDVEVVLRVGNVAKPVLLVEGWTEFSIIIEPKTEE